MLPTTMWLVILFALIVSVLIGLVEIVLSPVVVSSAVFSTVSITVEVLRATFAFGVFGVVFITRRFSLDRRSLFIAVAFLAVGFFTILRLLTSPNMPSMMGPTEDVNHSLYFSVFLRYTVGGAMLISAFIPKDFQARPRDTACSLILAAIYILAAIVFIMTPGSPLPDLQTDAAALNPLQAELEYGSMVLAFFAAIAYARLTVAWNETRYALVAVGLILFAQAGFAFMESPSSGDMVFLIGRATALVGFFLVFYAVMKNSLYYPYLKLDRATSDYIATKSEVEKRTAEMRVLAQDLTERRLAEAALRKSEKNYRDLVDTTTEGIWKIDADAKIMFVNPQMAEMLGYSAGEMTGRLVFDFVDSSSLELFTKNIEERKRGLKGHYDMTIVRKDGERVHVLVSAIPNIDDLGEYIGSVAFLTDITERKKAEVALRESERTLFKFLVDLPVGIVVCDSEGKHLFANDKSRRLLGKGFDPQMLPEESAGFYQAYIAGTDRPYPSERAPLFRALKGESSMVDDIEIRRPSETLRLEVWGAPVLDEDGKVAYGIAAFQDITERKETEKQITELNEDLEKQTEHLADINKELEAFCYSVSHDLRAPLRSIDGFSNILIEDYDKILDDKGKDHLRRVRSNCQRMGQLIDDLLKLSKVTRDEMKWEPVDLSKIAKSVLAEMRKLQPDRKIKITIADGAHVVGDSHLYRILLTNLLDNAWKFTERQPNPVIEFGVTTINGERVYFVRDNGAGFDMKYGDKLFTPFQRLHSPLEFAGTGIGLATAQRVVRRHGGRIWAEAQPGKGATFYFTEGQRGSPERDT